MSTFLKGFTSGFTSALLLAVVIAFVAPFLISIFQKTRGWECLHCEASMNSSQTEENRHINLVVWLAWAKHRSFSTCAKTYNHEYKSRKKMK